MLLLASSAIIISKPQFAWTGGEAKGNSNCTWETAWSEVYVPAIYSDYWIQVASSNVYE